MQSNVKFNKDKCYLLFKHCMYKNTKPGNEPIPGFVILFLLKISVIDNPDSGDILVLQ